MEGFGSAPESRVVEVLRCECGHPHMVGPDGADEGCSVCKCSVWLIADDHCFICGHLHDRKLGICPDWCAGCGRDLSQVADGASEDCPVCLRFLDGCKSSGLASTLAALPPPESASKSRPFDPPLHT